MPAPFETAASTIPFLGEPELEVADLDADGHLDLLARFGTDAVAVAWGSGRAMPSLLEVPTPKGMTQTFVTAAALGCSAVSDLLVLASGAGESQAIYRVHLDASTRSFSGFDRIAFTPGAVAIAAGDTNGDGLVDIVWTDGAAAHVLLAQPGEGPSCGTSP
jgi:hypothetical protein